MRAFVPCYGCRTSGWLLKGVVSLGLVFSLALVLSPNQASAQGSLAGQIENVMGTLVVVRPDSIEERVQGKTMLQLFEWDALRTEPGSQALIIVKDDIQVALNENSVLMVLARWEKAKGITRILRLQQGEIWVKTGAGPKQLEVETPVAAAAVRETEFNIKVLDDGQTILTVIQGVVEFGTAFGTCPIRTSTVSYGVRGKRCTKPESADVKPAVAWTVGIVKYEVRRYPCIPSAVRGLSRTLLISLTVKLGVPDSVAACPYDDHPATAMIAL